MLKLIIKTLTGVVIAISCFSLNLNAQNTLNTGNVLSLKEQSIISISALTAKGDLLKLKTALHDGLDRGLTINQIKEAIVHLYAYCGFPRSIRGLQTFMEVLEERKARGIYDNPGTEASPVNQEPSKYERGKKILGELTRAPQNGPLTGYGAFAPAMDQFLKEHLFADIFERDVLTYAQRELVTISVISAIGGADPMLRSHLAISQNLGWTPGQLNEALDIVKSTLDRRGDKINSSNFSGTAWLQMFVNNDSLFNANIGNVTFEPKARTNWHIHPGGQILLVTDGSGYYQEKGKAAQRIQKGDVVKIAPGIEHWHGGSPETGLTHIAISLNTDKGGAVWTGPVTDEEFNSIEK